jgi:hypothetical protein
VIELSSQAFVPQSGFRLVPFRVQIVAQAAGWPAFPLLEFLVAPNRSTEAWPATRLSRSSVERSVRIRRPAQVVPAATTAGGRDCRSPYFSRSNAISDLTWNNQRSGIARSSGLNLVQRRLFKIAREPSADANLEGAQPEPAGQRGAAEKSKGPRRHIQGAFATRA